MCLKVTIEKYQDYKLKKSGKSQKFENHKGEKQ
jgi:hypothetical protein